jgi:broad specificity phosphatase PhoE
LTDDRSASLLRNLDGVPVDAPVCLLLRHSARDRIAPGETGNELPLTPEGVRLAEELGRALGSRIAGLRASPVERCVQTAECLARGTGGAGKMGSPVEGGGAGEPDLSIEPAVPVTIDAHLGGPGVYVEDLELVWQEFWRLGRTAFLHRVMECGLNGAPALPGLVRTDVAARRLVGHMLGLAKGKPGVHVFVTHDVIIVPTVACCLGAPLPKPLWPAFLEGGLFWRENGAVRLRYQDLDTTSKLDLNAP